MNEKIILKIQKLLALQQNPNQAEAEAAIIKVNELLTKYNLSLSDISKKEQDFDIEDIKMKHSHSNIYRTLVKAIAVYYYCECLCNRVGDIYIVGKKHNGLVAKLMVEYVDNAIERETKNIIAGTKIKNNFRYGAIIAIGKRLQQMRKEQEQTTEINALVISEKGIIDKHLRQRNIKESKKDYDVSEETAFINGYRVGQKISLNEQIVRDKQKELR